MTTPLKKTSVSPKVSPRRRSLLGKVHIAKKQLKLDDDTYRDILNANFKKQSASKLSDRQLVGLIEHFKSLGFKAKRKPPARAGRVKPAQQDTARKIRALWISLYHLGVVRDPSEKALTAFGKRLTGGKKNGVDALQWIDDKGAFKVIESLKKMAEREAGVDWTAYHNVFMHALPVNPRKRVIAAQVSILKGKVSGEEILEAAPLLESCNIYVDFPEPATLEAHLDETIQALGTLVRNHKAATTS